MYPPRILHRRYRLRNKKRLLGGTAIAVALVLGCILAITLATPGNPSFAADLPITGSPNPSAASGFTTDHMAVSAMSHNVEIEPSKTAPIARQNDWRLLLVNKDHPLPQSYRSQMRELPNGLLIDARIYDDLMAMINEGESQGLDFVICSAYRSVEKQQELFDAQVAVEMSEGLNHEKAVEATATKVAPPGTSEHNLGLAADIVAFSYQKLDKGFCDTPECSWLRENAHRFGFILRYPEEKSSVTGIIYEPWHFRYVGKEVAEAIRQNGLCLEEYLESLRP